VVVFVADLVEVVVVVVVAVVVVLVTVDVPIVVRVGCFLQITLQSR